MMVQGLQHNHKHPKEEEDLLQNIHIVQKFLV